MTLARCPACHTAFRIAPEQLDQRGGRVRCGKCFHPFNAFEHPLKPVPTPHVSSSPDRPLSARPTSPMTPSGLNETPADDNFTLQPLDPDFFQAVVDARRREHPTEKGSLGPERPQLIDSTSSPSQSHTSHPFFGSDSLDTWLNEPIRGTPKETPQAVTLVALEDAVLPQVFHHRREESAPQKISFNAADENDINHLTLEAATPVAHEEEDEREAEEEDEDLEAWRDEAYRPGAPREPRRGWWALGIGILLGTLIAQAGYIYREPLTRAVPQLRPLYLAACAQLNCEVPLPRVADALAIVASRLEPQPGTVRGYLLFAGITNSAPHPQEYPHLELTLRDKNDQPLARRTFSPQEWIPDDRDSAEGILASERLDISLPFSTDARAEPVGYRIGLFYP